MGRLIDVDEIPFFVEEDGAVVAYKADIEQIPSALPEVIRCKDCRWGREACGNIECFADTNVPPEYHGYEWFCPNGERRTDGMVSI